MHNLADQPAYASVQQKLRADLSQWMQDTLDPRVVHDDDHWDQYPYYGGRAQMSAPVK